jgi:hypothetical protein
MPGGGGARPTIWAINHGSNFPVGWKVRVEAFVGPCQLRLQSLECQAIGFCFGLECGRFQGKAEAGQGGAECISRHCRVCL